MMIIATSGKKMVPPRCLILVRASLFNSSAPSSNSFTLPHLSNLDFKLLSVDYMAVKISSKNLINKLNCVSDLLSDFIKNIGCATLFTYIVPLQVSPIFDLVMTDSET